MKAFKLFPDGVMREADVPDGVLLLEIGATLNPSGGPDLKPIALIDHERGVYRREGNGFVQGIPKRTIRLSALKWDPPL